MRWGIRIALLAGIAVLAVPAGAVADGPVYQPAPVYEPAEPPPTAAPVAVPPRNGFRIQRVRRLPGNGRAIAFVRVFAAGRVILWGRGIRTVARGTRQPRIVQVPVKPKVRLRRYLRRRGKARVRINVAFRPFGGFARAPRERPLVLRKRRR